MRNYKCNEIGIDKRESSRRQQKVTNRKKKLRQIDNRQLFGQLKYSDILIVIVGYRIILSYRITLFTYVCR